MPGEGPGQYPCGYASGPRRCWLLAHPGKAAHIDYSTGWPQPFLEVTERWQNVGLPVGEVLPDAPEVFRHE